MDRYRIHGSIHARPPQVAPGAVQKVLGHEVALLAVTPEMLAAGMALSFEEAAERLQRLPRMFLEPDGSFVWVSPAAEPAWQLDGVLYDRNGHLQFIDVRGEFTAESLAAFLEAIAGSQPVMFQLAREALFLDEDAFRTVCLVQVPPQGGETARLG